MIDRVRQLAAFAIVASLGLTLACDDDDDEPTGPNVVRTTFNATLTGDAERPDPVTTTANGTAQLVLFDEDSVTFTIQVASIDSVIMAHVHAGDAETAGPILFPFPASDPPLSFTTLADLHTGVITPSSSFAGAFTFDSLVTRLQAGTAYVNVHTRANTGGEIRGQLTEQP